MRYLFLGVRQQYLTMRGQETGGTVEAMRGILASADFVPFQRFDHMSAYETLLAGRPETAVREFQATYGVMARAIGEALAGGSIAAAYARDVVAARDASNRLQEWDEGGRGGDAIRELGRAVVHALEGREESATASFVRAVERMRAGKNHFWVAVLQAVALELQPARSSTDGWEEEARARFELLAAAPWLRLLDASVMRATRDRPSVAVTAETTSPVGSES